MTKKCRSAAFVLLLAPPVAASAAPFISILSKQDRYLCRIDVKALCGDVGKRQALDCLLTRADQIQDGDCKAAVSAAQGRLDAIHQACQFDIDTKCDEKKVTVGLFSCLTRHRKELLGSCKDGIRDNYSY